MAAKAIPLLRKRSSISSSSGVKTENARLAISGVCINLHSTDQNVLFSCFAMSFTGTPALRELIRSSVSSLVHGLTGAEYSVRCCLSDAFFMPPIEYPDSEGSDLISSLLVHLSQAARYSRRFPTYHDLFSARSESSFALSAGVMYFILLTC